MGGMSFNYFYPLLDDYMTMSAIDKPRNLRLWTWEDSSKIVNFVNLHLIKAQKYCLDIPIIRSNNMTKEELKQMEDDLTERFLQELRKKPQQA